MSGNVSTDAPLAPPVLLAISGFRRDEALWPRAGLRRVRVREFVLLYREGGEAALPQIVVAQVDGRRYLVDGWHRCAAAEAAGLPHLPALVVRMERVEDVYLEAVSLCATSDRPLPLTQVEKRAATDRLLKLAPRYSDRCIARLAGVTHPFVGDRRRLIEVSRERGDAVPTRPLPSRRAAARIVSGALALNRLAGNLRHTTDGALLDPVAALEAAARAQGAAGAAALARLAQWALQLERRGARENPAR